MVLSIFVVSSFLSGYVLGLVSKDFFDSAQKYIFVAADWVSNKYLEFKENYEDPEIELQTFPYITQCIVLGEDDEIVDISDILNMKFEDGELIDLNTTDLKEYNIQDQTVWVYYKWKGEEYVILCTLDDLEKLPKSKLLNPPSPKRVKVIDISLSLNEDFINENLEIVEKKYWDVKDVFKKLLGPEQDFHGRTPTFKEFLFWLEKIEDSIEIPPAEDFGCKWELIITKLGKQIIIPKYSDPLVFN